MDSDLLPENIYIEINMVINNSYRILNSSSALYISQHYNLAVKMIKLLRDSVVSLKIRISQCRLDRIPSKVYRLQLKNIKMLLKQLTKFERVCKNRMLFLM